MSEPQTIDQGIVASSDASSRPVRAPRPSCSFSYTVTPAEPKTSDCGAADAYCEVFNIKIDDHLVLVPQYVRDACERLAEAVEMFREEERPC